MRIIFLNEMKLDLVAQERQSYIDATKILEKYYNLRNTTADKVTSIDQFIDIAPHVQKILEQDWIPDFLFQVDEASKTADLNRTIDRLDEKCADLDFSHLVKKNSTGKKAYKLAELLRIKESMKHSIDQLRIDFRWAVLQKLKNEAKQLDALLKFFYSKQKKYLNRLRSTPLNHNTRDKRLLLLQSGDPVCKYLSNMSDCEEDARFTKVTNSKPDLSISQSENICIKLNYYLERSIPLWNLQKTG